MKCTEQKSIYCSMFNLLQRSRIKIVLNKFNKCLLIELLQGHSDNADGSRYVPGFLWDVVDYLCLHALQTGGLIYFPFLIPAFYLP